MNSTRQQHHVWRSYLGAWATNDKIFCLQDGEIIRPNIKGVAVERDFYKLETVTSRDIEGIRLVVGKTFKSAQRVNENFITCNRRRQNPSVK